MEFQNRISQNPNRRRLKIISSESDKMIVDIERDEELEGVTEVGTPLTAELLNQWDKSVQTATTLAESAQTYVEGKKEAISQAIAGSSEALTTATQALETANKASEDAKTAVEKSGTAIYFNDDLQSSIKFTSDPQTQLTALKRGFSKTYNAGDWVETAGVYSITVKAETHELGLNARVVEFNDGNGDEFLWKRTLNGDIIIFSTMQVGMTVRLK